jgi:hypothetical protein
VSVRRSDYYSQTCTLKTESGKQKMSLWTAHSDGSKEALKTCQKKWSEHTMCPNAKNRVLKPLWLKAFKNGSYLINNIIIKERCHTSINGERYNASIEAKAKETIDA